MIFSPTCRKIYCFESHHLTEFYHHAQSNRIGTISNTDRFFVVTPYSQSGRSGEKPTVIIPENCPKYQSKRSECHVCLNFWRERKTGPLLFLAVVKCLLHKIAFTLYPPGFLPWQRCTLIGNIDLDGKPIGVEGEEQEETIDLLTAGTLFEGAFDKAQGEVWPKEQLDSVKTTRFDTQSRHIRKNALLLALNPDTTPKINEAITGVLNLNSLTIAEHSRRIESSGTDQSRSVAILSVLKTLLPLDSLFERLTVAGSFLRLWPSPWRVNRIDKSLRPSFFLRFAPPIQAEEFL